MMAVYLVFSLFCETIWTDDMRPLGSMDDSVSGEPSMLISGV